jgi:alanine transaminase
MRPAFNNVSQYMKSSRALPLRSLSGSVVGTPESLSEKTLNASVVNATYAVRGKVLDRAMALQAQLASDPSSVPFDEIVQCNIGNPQSLGQKPLSYHREVLALTIAPSLLDKALKLQAEGKPTGFEPDVLTRAKAYLDSVPSMGAYTHSQGIALVRQQVADFITERDGAKYGKANPNNIFMTNGASDGVRINMTTFMRNSPGDKDGILVPIPQYPLYSASCTILKGDLVPYYLNEEEGWSMGIDELKKQLTSARQQGTSVRGLVVINPGNPTGPSLSLEDMKEVVSLCAQENIVLFADEVYQENIWRPDRPFHSFRKVARMMGYEDKSDGGLNLVSMHSISKGFIGECGLRGGYFELFGIPDEVKAQLYKLASISLSSNTAGQVMAGLMVQPPKSGEPSYTSYCNERDAILSSLKSRATKVSSSLNALPGVTCRMSDGALYAFPNIELPEKYVQHASAQGMQADEMYCLEMLEATGVVVVPGSGFGQVEGTWHFRTTFLPAEEKIDGVLERVRVFHTDLMNKWK